MLFVYLIQRKLLLRRLSNILVVVDDTLIVAMQIGALLVKKLLQRS